MTRHLTRLVALSGALALTALGFAVAVVVTSPAESFNEVLAVWGLGLGASGLVFAIHGTTVEVMDHRRSARADTPPDAANTSTNGMSTNDAHPSDADPSDADPSDARSGDRGRRVWLMVGLLFLSHLVQIQLYGLVLFFAAGLGLGGLQGDLTTGAGSFPDYLYFSFAAYTSLGLGDIAPTGPLRLLTGLETLTGLLCIGWSTAYIFNALKAQASR